MQTPLFFLACSTLTLGIVAGIFRIEDARSGQRLVLTRTRESFDTLMGNIFDIVSQVDTYVGRGFARLMLHYAAHSILHRLHTLLSTVQIKVEHLLRQNKQVAVDLNIKKHKTHLDKIAEHKAKVALTEEQKMKLRSHEYIQ